jgi:endoglucanase
MANTIFSRIALALMSILFVNIGSICAQSTTGQQPNIFKSEVGAPLQSTGTVQIQPQIGHVGAVAPDLLCIEIDACRIFPAVQIPYQPEPSDVITIKNYSPLGEPNTMRVQRNGFPLGMLVGKDRKTLTVYERLNGIHLDVNLADKPDSYSITSTSDKNIAEAVRPLAIWRKSKPSNYPEENRKGGEFYTAKHFVYLKLPFPMKTGEAYRINISGLNTDKPVFYYVHDPLVIRSEAVHVSQIGFRADDPDKNAFLSVWMGTGGGYSYPENTAFSLVDVKTNEKVYSGKASMQWKGDVPEEVGTMVNHSGTDVLRLDFSGFNIPGTYRVCVEGIGCSYPFKISDSGTWDYAFKISMKGHFHQRSGIPMGPPYTDFIRPRSFHPADGVKVYQSTCSLLNSGNGLNAMATDKDNFGNLVAGKTDELVPEAWGGTMDAGDWDRRIIHLMAPRLYLELMELNPEYFKNINLNIPESGNDLPDLVDEALFGLDVYRRMQLPDGGIRGGIESSEHPAEGSTSWQEALTVLAYAPDHWSAYIYTGVAARAAFVLKMLGKTNEAAVWEESAIRAMNWAEIEYQKWIAADDYAKVTPRAKQMVPVERNLAAAELYRLTFDKRWDSVYQSSLHKVSNRTEADFIYARFDKTQADNKIVVDAQKRVVSEADRLVELAGKNAYGITTHIPGRALGGWESTYSIPAAQSLVRGHYITDNPLYLKTILRSTLFTAGANPMNLCLTTGLGENCVKHPLHEDSRHTGQPAPIGISVCGPGEIPVYAKPGSDMEKRLNTECTPPGVKWPSAEAYFDLYGWDLQNEYVVDRNMGPTAYIWGYLAARK